MTLRDRVRDLETRANMAGGRIEKVRQELAALRKEGTLDLEAMTELAHQVRGVVLALRELIGDVRRLEARVDGLESHE